VFVVRRGAGTPPGLVCAPNGTSEVVVIDGFVGTDVLTGQQVGPLRLPAYGYAWVSPDRALTAAAALDRE
jgi:hypothetical protein